MRVYSLQQRPDISHVYIPMTASYGRLKDLILFLKHACSGSQPERVTSESFQNSICKCCSAALYLTFPIWKDHDTQLKAISKSIRCIEKSSVLLIVFPYPYTPSICGRLRQRRSNGSSEQYLIGMQSVPTPRLHATYGTDHCDVLYRIACKIFPPTETDVRCHYGGLCCAERNWWTRRDGLEFSAMGYV